MKLLFYPLLLLLAFVPMMAQAGNTFDPATNTLSMDHVRTTDGASYTDLEVKIFDYEVIDAKVAVMAEETVNPVKNDQNKPKSLKFKQKPLNLRIRRFLF